MINNILGNPDNPSKRIPVALCIDTSESMSDVITEINNAIQSFYIECRNDKHAKNAIEIITVDYACHGVKIASSFDEVEFAQIPRFNAGHAPLMGQGVMLALDELERRKTWYQDEGLDYYTPILVIVTNSHSDDDISEASRRASKLVKYERLTVFPVAVGSSADINILESFGQKCIQTSDQFSLIDFFRSLIASEIAMAEGKDFDLSEFF